MQLAHPVEAGDLLGNSAAWFLLLGELYCLLTLKLENVSLQLKLEQNLTKRAYQPPQ